MSKYSNACGHCFYCEHNEFSQCDTTNKHGEAGGANHMEIMQDDRQNI